MEHQVLLLDSQDLPPNHDPSQSQSVVCVCVCVRACVAVVVVGGGQFMTQSVRRLYSIKWLDLEGSHHEQTEVRP
jgi:hypothetical protein